MTETATWCCASPPLAALVHAAAADGCDVDEALRRVHEHEPSATLDDLVAEVHLARSMLAAQPALEQTQ